MKHYLSFLKNMTIDLLKGWHRIWSLAVFQYKLSNKEMVLGQFWKLVTPFVQIGIYWLVFGLGLRNGRNVDGVPYVVWLVCGLTPWFIINSSVLSTQNSIFSKAAVISRSNIMPYFLPVSSVWSVFLNYSWTLGLMFIIYFANGCVPTATAFGVLYYLVCCLVLSSVIGLITSVLVMLARDFQVIIQLVMRLMFFLSPIIWEPGDNLPGLFLLFDKYNMFGYIIRGFRTSLLGNTWFFADFEMMVTFWVIVLVLYLLSAAMQMRLRRNILDFL